MRSHRGQRALLRLTPLGLGLLLLAAAGAPAPPSESRLEGEVVLTLRGPGAAPFGIASAILGGSGFAYNLARLHQDLGPTGVLEEFVDESYGGRARFRLTPRAWHHWVLEEVEVDYDFAGRSRLAEEGGPEVWDRMNDSGTVRFADGEWSGRPGWDPQADPGVELRLFYAREAADCERPAGWMRRQVSRLRHGPDDVLCYQLEVDIPHPMRPTGESAIESPLGKVGVTARDGALSFSGDPAFGPPGLLQQWEQVLEGGLTIAEPGIDFAIRTTASGVVRRGRVESSAVFRILTGALALESLELPIFELELEKTQEDWLPEDGNQVMVTVHNRAADPLPVPIRFTLFEVTREPGTSLNSRDRSRDLDLHLETADNPLFHGPRRRRAGWRIETREPVPEVELIVRSRDYGAWGKVRAEARLGRTWFPIPVDASDLEYATIPRDEEGGENRIADAWEWQMGLAPGGDPEADEEDAPGQRFQGDGLTLYEEYRGAYVQGRHMRFDPRVKDLFVHVTPGSGLAGYVRRAEALLAGIRLHLVRERELVSRRVRRINLNRGDVSVAEQHGVVVYSRSVPRAYGQVVCRAGSRCASPRDAERVEINRAAHLVERGGRWVLDERELVATIAHELLHAVGVSHHGFGDYREVLCSTLVDGERRHFRCPRGSPRRWPREIADWRGESSGDQHCVMAYRIATGFRRQGAEPDRLVELVFEPGSHYLQPFQAPDPAANQVCGSNAGTDFNADGQQVGNARLGNCTHAIRVSDPEDS